VNKCITPLAFSLLLAASAAVQGSDLKTMIELLRDGEISLEMLNALIQLDKPGYKVGYGLCEAAGEPLCDVNGSVGYGLCKVSGAPLCKVKGTIGYGLCTLAGEFNCKPNASIGHGLCRLAGEKNCKP